MSNPVTSICGHNYCHKCFIQIKAICPICNTNLRKRDFTLNSKLKTDIDNLKELRGINNETKEYHIIKNAFEVNKNDENMYNDTTNLKTRIKRKHSEINSLDTNKISEIRYRTIYNSQIQGISNSFEFFIDSKNCDAVSIESSEISDNIEISPEYHKRFKFN
jgi:recombinational DNA repair protein RecR